MAYTREEAYKFCRKVCPEGRRHNKTWNGHAIRNLLNGTAGTCQGWAGHVLAAVAEGTLLAIERYGVPRGFQVFLDCWLLTHKRPFRKRGSRPSMLPVR